MKDKKKRGSRIDAERTGVKGKPLKAAQNNLLLALLFRIPLRLSFFFAIFASNALLAGPWPACLLTEV